MIIRLGNHTIGLKQSDMISKIQSRHGKDPAKAATSPKSSSTDILVETETLDEIQAGRFKSLPHSPPYILFRQRKHIATDAGIYGTYFHVQNGGII